MRRTASDRRMSFSYTGERSAEAIFSYLEGIVREEKSMGRTEELDALAQEFVSAADKEAVLAKVSLPHWALSVLSRLSNMICSLILFFRIRPRPFQTQRVQVTSISWRRSWTRGANTLKLRRTEFPS